MPNPDQIKAWQRSGDRYVGRHAPFPEFQPPEDFVRGVAGGHNATDAGSAVEVVSVAAVTPCDEPMETETIDIVEPITSVETLISTEKAEAVGDAPILKLRATIRPSQSVEVGETATTPAIEPRNAVTVTSSSWYDELLEEEAETAAQRDASEQPQQGQDEWVQRRQNEERRTAAICEAERQEAARQAQQEQRAEDERRKEAAKRAAAAEVRLLNNGLSFLLRRPHAEQPAVMLVETPEQENEESGRTRCVAGHGAVPKKRAAESNEERESRQAEAELESYLRKAEKVTQRVEPQRAAQRTSRFLPITSEATGQWESAEWDAPQTGGHNRPPPLPVENRARSRSSTRVKRKKRSDRYQWTMEDYFSGGPEPAPSSPPPGPPSGPPSRVRRDPPDQNNVEISATIPSYPIRRTGIQFGGLVPIPTDPRVDPPPFACFNCWERGHPALRCPRPRSGTFCHNCGRRGEDLSVCPRCSEPHRRYVETTFAHERGPSLETGTRRQVASTVHDNPQETRAGQVAWRQSRAALPPRVLHQGHNPATTSQPDIELERPGQAGQPRVSALDRLGDRVDRTAQQRDAVREALTIIEGLQGLPTDVREDVIRYAFSQRRPHERN